ncbi:MAG: class I SAM-dependent methyltransferase [Clostridiales bacterium]|nr:class I SAM-dependent methyltransferase [Clostridiales bacterium]
MSTNQDKIFEKYTVTQEDGRETYSRTDSLEYYYTQKHLEGFINPTDKVLEIGCATGYYGFYYADKCREYLGIDLFPPHIELLNGRIKDRKITNMSAHVGDAINLENIPDNSFDVVLCLGPMYHLPREERELAFKEAARVCKNGGIAAFAYIVSKGTYAGACVLDRKYPNELANDHVLNKGTDDMRPELFFYTTPEEMEETANRYRLCKVKNLGTNFMCLLQRVNEMTDEEFEVMRPLYDQMTSHESCTGMAGHALLICKKE